MKYKKIKAAVFVERPNRFIANVLLDGKMETVHVKNTGRCKELLVVGARVILEEVGNPNRKTKYSIIAVYKNGMLINMDSQAPNAVVYEALMDGLISGLEDLSVIKREAAYNKSRLDIYYEKGIRKGFIEVKGVTLEGGNVAMFPDAPTVRGTKHIYELIEAKKEGYEANILFLIQMAGPVLFMPNVDTDPDFREALKTAYENGVNILVYDSKVGETHIEINNVIKLKIL